MIEVDINGERRVLERPITVVDLLDLEGIKTHGIAVAVNSEVVPRSEFERVLVSDLDRVEILHAVGGG